MRILGESPANSVCEGSLGRVGSGMLCLPSSPFSIPAPSSSSFFFLPHPAPLFDRIKMSSEGHSAGCLAAMTCLLSLTCRSQSCTCFLKTQLLTSPTQENATVPASIFHFKMFLFLCNFTFSSQVPLSGFTTSFQILRLHGSAG